MKFAFASALAFAGTLSVNAQITAPEWAVEQNATIQHVGENMQLGDRFFLADEVLLVEITKISEVDDYAYEVKVVGVNDLKVAGLTELVIPFSDFDKNINSKIVSVDPIAAYDPSADKTPLSTDLSGITKLTVGYKLTDDHLPEPGYGIESIADNAFAKLTALTEIYSYCIEPPTMTAAAFPSAVYANENVKLFVAPITLGTTAGKFANAAGWNKFFGKLYTIGYEFAFGDFDCNGKIKAKDASALFDYQAESYSGDVNEFSIDVDGNGKFKAKDASALFDLISNM